MEPPPECDDGDVRVVAAIDKFRGTATAADAAAAVCRGAAKAGWECDARPMHAESQRLPVDHERAQSVEQPRHQVDARDRP